jgi:2,5-diamino-6-(ribosylamino)-4(3H)-pyrimidinone 5'-phosphate reductase
MEKPMATLFTLMSVDGKISTGNIYDRDMDEDFTKIAGIEEGLKQYQHLFTQGGINEQTAIIHKAR